MSEAISKFKKVRMYIDKMDDKKLNRLCIILTIVDAILLFGLIVTNS